ncbi:MAG: AhpC/TSA family protein [Phycisphaeraceae bacterium]|nr:AhpC/TSA family protein [Phycisphaeraceae bacterium]
MPNVVGTTHRLVHANDKEDAEPARNGGKPSLTGGIQPSTTLEHSRMVDQISTNSQASPGGPTPPWMGAVLRIAGVYNIVWGAWSVLDPRFPFIFLGAPVPTDTFIWQCLGMVIGVYGIGYWLAASNPARHWPIVLVGLLGKIFGPIGFVWTALITRDAPAELWPMLIANDLVWWIPFTLILAHAWRANEATRLSRIATVDTSADRAAPDTALLSVARASDGRTLREISDVGPTLVVFLRHIGCTFCREAVADLARMKPRLDASHVSVILVHMSEPRRAGAYFATMGLSDTPHISDPDRSLYRAFELQRGRLGALFGARVWIRGLRAGLLDRHGVGRLEGDGFQMPGAFLVHRGRILRAFRHESASDRPDYCELAGA